LPRRIYRARSQPARSAPLTIALIERLGILLPDLPVQQPRTTHSPAVSAYWRRRPGSTGRSLLALFSFETRLASPSRSAAIPCCTARLPRCPRPRSRALSRRPCLTPNHERARRGGSANLVPVPGDRGRIQGRRRPVHGLRLRRSRPIPPWPGPRRRSQHIEPNLGASSLGSPGTTPVGTSPDLELGKLSCSRACGRGGRSRERRGAGASFSDLAPSTGRAPSRRGPPLTERKSVDRPTLP
jgi:hypothetical protein